jgi:pyruvate/2-oxoglutarate/acetoin dehydrogenase E1 component
VSAPRVAEALNEALHQLMANRPNLYLLGEDILDPYGGAFRVTRGLSSQFPDRVLGMPISESAIVGIGNGFALAGDQVIAEIMFGDFISLAVDQICNFAAKSVTMYGRIVPLRMVVRCPVGGGRGYGPTHSQSLQKHFIGFPNLVLAEMSPFHDPRALLERLLDLGQPVILFEDKRLYGQRVFRDGTIDDVFGYAPVGDGGWMRVAVRGEEAVDIVLVAPGGLVHRAIEAARIMLLEHDLLPQILTPATLYPLDPAPVLDAIGACGRVAIIEDSSAGGTWGAEVASQCTRQAWTGLAAPIALVHGPDSIIPSAAHLENAISVSPEQIVAEALELAHA